MKKLFSALLLSIPLLSSCGLLFDNRPKTMTIEYDEEVKLHDGSMIWVHITRHYVLAGGGALGDPGAFEKNYVPKEVEISWDTGFEGVGRKSVFFDSLSMIEKNDNTWFLFGGSPYSTNKMLNNSINCKPISTKMGQSEACFVSINNTGKFIKPNEDDLFQFVPNILNPIGIKDWGFVPYELNNTKLSWQMKLNLQKNQPKKYRFIGEAYNKEKFQ